MLREEKLYTTSADYVYDELLHKILMRQIKPGEHLAEVNIAVSLGVSRTPVREALRRLASQGLLEVIPNVGAKVVSPTQKDLEDTFMVRNALETMAVRLAVKNINPTYLAEMEEAIKQEEQALRSGDFEEYLGVNEEFHRIIAQLSGNNVLEDFIKNCIARISIYTVFTEPPVEEIIRTSLAEHKEILNAIKERDVDRAEKTMEEHIINTLNSLLLYDKKNR
ncbi:MAG: GntR family transcriptional regulator [Acetomicrobium flavidum]|uniref:GntR family transcriptional regulator n=1 Tax=Acetomicrobium flavidum TaxID=49896 RepID=UPI0016996F82|nr:GntR family transcriptional regulator [Acetomicrobium flavidum]